MPIRYARLVAIVSVAVLALVMAPAVTSVVPAAPTPDGRFYGDNDRANYDLVATALGGRGTLYARQIGDMVYVAVEVDPKVNDNVFGKKVGSPNDSDYLQSANWEAIHTADRLIGSDHVQIALGCGDQGWTWNHGYLYDNDGDQNPSEADWLSGPGDGSVGGGSPPPGLTTASTLQWNMNNAVEKWDGLGWDVTLSGTRSGSGAWKSVDANTIGDVTDDGWGTTWYNSTYGWEWKMVYEMSIDLGPEGANCEGAAPTVQILSAHNSPSKDSGEDVPIPVADFGDAPESYQTLLANDGARHLIPLDSSGPFMGIKRDTDPDGQPTSGADGDDLLDGNDDEDVQCWCRGNLVAGEEGETDISLLGSSDGCYVSAWVDFDGDGEWDDPGEQIITDEWVVGNTMPFFAFDVPPDAVLMAQTYARFRCTTQEGLPFYGEAPDGEVEDYEVMIFDGPVEFGDLPDTYGTLFGSGGAFHAIQEGFSLGLRADSEPNGKPTDDAEGDDSCGLFGDDEDGVTLPPELAPGEEACVEVFLRDDYGYGGVLDVWMDYHGDGWTLPDDHVLVGVPLVTGVNAGPAFCFMVPADAPPGGLVYARFRLSAAGKTTMLGQAPAAIGPQELTDPGGFWPNGEVEDYLLVIPTSVTLIDLEASSVFDVRPGLALVALAGLVLAASAWLLHLRRGQRSG